MDQSELEKRLLEAFSEEAEERLENLFARLTELENVATEDRRRELLEIVFREAHSLKGAARSVNLSPIESLCQSMETVFGLLKDGALAFSSHLFDSLHDAAKAVERYTVGDDAVRKAMHADMAGLANRIEELAHRKDSVCQPERAETDISGATAAAAEPQASASPAHEMEYRQFATDTVRISSSKLDALLLKTEEMIVLKQFAGQMLFRLKEFRDTLEKQVKEHERRRSNLFDHRNFPDSPHTVSEGLQEYFDTVAVNHREAVERIKDLVKSVEQGNRSVSTLVDDLLSDMKKATLLPFSTLFAILPRMTREIARDRNKIIDIRLSGGEIEIDKRILERIKDPVIHLIRNAIDHGIEPPDQRVLSGKPDKGTISISVSQVEGNRIEFTVSDDGGGIDIRALGEKAVKKGIVLENELNCFTDDDAISLIFHSGISTSRSVNEISGRGLGMAIVKEVVEGLGGTLELSSSAGRGTVLKMRLPITQATFRGILIKSAGHHFIIPNAQVLHLVQIRPGEIHRVENRPVIRIGRKAVGLVRLSTVLGLTRPEEKKIYCRQQGDEIYTAAILGSGEEQIAFLIDGVLNEQEVLVKSLGKQLARVPLIAGATVLGTGRVVPVLNVRELILSAAGRNDVSDFDESAPEITLSDRRSVLVVEDSFTSRTLLKHILEASGYHVETAINGEDGFGMVKSGTFDAVVSDVEMPRMNGFELTEKIRTEKGIADTPVVLVTSLDSRQDRERGIDVGADAYIVKTSFDQSNLLEVLERLIH